MKFLLTRTYQGSNTLGQIDVISDDNEVLDTVFSLELPWMGNKQRVSCIPVGTYPIQKHTSPKFGKCFWIREVPNRSEILIHPANYTRQLLGCIATGLSHADIYRDGELDTVSSRDALEVLLNYNPTKIEIIEI